MTIPTQRQARRARDREDFVRATQQSVPAKYKLAAGVNAGPTYREHLENQIADMVERYNHAVAKDDKDKARTARGIIRGLAIALLLYEDSYSIDDKAKLLKIEKGFMK